MTSAMDHLKSALDDLMGQRMEVDRQIEVIKRTMAELQGTLGMSWPLAPDIPTRTVPSVADTVLALSSAGNVFTMNEIMDALDHVGNPAQKTSVASIVSRMVSQGLIGKGPQRGTFVQVPQVVSGDQMADQIGRAHV